MRILSKTHRSMRIEIIGVYYRFSIANKIYHDCDGYSASLLGIIKCTCISVLRSVWELFVLCFIKDYKDDFFSIKIEFNAIWLTNIVVYAGIHTSTCAKPCSIIRSMFPQYREVCVCTLFSGPLNQHTGCAKENLFFFSPRDIFIKCNTELACIVYCQLKRFLISNIISINHQNVNSNKLLNPSVTCKNIYLNSVQIIW